MFPLVTSRSLPYLNVQKFDKKILEVIIGDLLCPKNVSSLTAYEAGVYTVQDFAKRIDPLRKAEADALSKRTATAQHMNQQAAIIAIPKAVLDFAQDVAEFVKHSSTQERKQVLRKFIKTIWIEPGHAKVVYRLPLPRALQENNDSDEGPALLREPVYPSTLLSTALDTRRWS